MSDQNRAPIYEALRQYASNRIVSFDVPGHKQGKGNGALLEAFGAKCLSMDLNSSKPLDNLTHPTSVIREAEQLAAQAFGAAHAFLMVGGTTAAVQAMIFHCCRPGDEIILPRNVHKSAINALILCGAIPVYINPGVHPRLGISLGMSVSDVRRAIAAHPKAKAVFVNNPTYYGVCSHLEEIVRLAHASGMRALVDEAHGTHLYFGEGLPLPAMRAGADMAAVSMHKTGGSLTQSSFLLTGPSVDGEAVRQIINLTQTTSGSYLLMASLDLARRELALSGRDTFRRVKRLCAYARAEINKIPGYLAFGSEILDGDRAYDFDATKLSVHTLDLGLAGIEVYDLLRDEYGIQIEFGDIGNILAILSVGDRELDIERLLGALSEILRRFQRDPMNMIQQEYIDPVVDMPPQKAFYAPKRKLPLEESAGCVSGEFVMAYPPGIPILAPGERITQEIIRYTRYAKQKGCVMTGPKDIELKFIEVVEMSLWSCGIPKSIVKTRDFPSG
ncbi:MAG: aminotransferase class I/II-fold pyridoxal phosphate-dependent enzyme [Oscillospiraceae bacterium]|nr:aminotransferase class I/II-fold pyridoxal phosphate-dependent enzyme [Oscillospiraceae bacterium]